LFYGLYKEQDSVFIVMELLPLGSLDNFLTDNEGGLETRDLLMMCVHISRGMSYLHSKNIVHNDLSARNVLLTKNDRETDGKYLLKVCDFGLSFASAQNYIYNTTTQQIPSKIHL
jgi:serine/threonine protein kinase